MMKVIGKVGFKKLPYLSSTAAFMIGFNAVLFVLLNLIFNLIFELFLKSSYDI